MEFFELVGARRSIRKYKPDAIEPERVTKILEAANSAPSAGNLQAYQIFVLRDAEKKGRLASATHDQQFVAEAPVVLVFCANPYLSTIKYGKRGFDLFAMQDATIAATFSMLAAASLGIGTVWVGSFDEAKVLEVLDNPRNMKPVAILPLGYPDEQPGPGQRKRLKDVSKEI